MGRGFVGGCAGYVHRITPGLPAGGWMRRKDGGPGIAASAQQHAQCAHTSHVGTCPACQRAAQRRSEAQLAAAVAAREVWSTRRLSRPS